MGKAEIESLRKQLLSYKSAFDKYKIELGNFLPKLKEMDDYNMYSVSLKHDIDKILFILTDLEFDTKKIKESKIIKKYLANEYSSMNIAKEEVVKLKKEIELNIPR
ncbi:MAG: hypothetical protein ACW981_15280 [Candidatus Hodarchaeales archaeon]